MLNRYRVLLFSMLACAISPAAGVTLLGEWSKTLSTGLVDQATGAPIASTYFVVREFTTVRSYHSARTYCYRGAITASPQGAPIAARLPGLKPIDPTTKGAGDTDYLEVTAYSPGYCAVQTAPGAEPSFKLSKLKRERFDYTTRPLKIITEPQITLKSARHADSAEQRLLYLIDLAGQMSCTYPNWEENSPAVGAEMAAAMVREAESLAKTAYEKYLVGRLKTALETRDAATDDRTTLLAMPARPVGSELPVNVVVAPEGSAFYWGNPQMPVVAVGKAHAAAAALAAAPPAMPKQPGAKAPATVTVAAQVITAKPDKPTLKVFCRFGELSRCDLNERNDQGQTLLERMVSNGRADEVEVLLAAGADPDIGSYPGAPTPLEGLLKSMLNYSSAYGDKARPADAARIINLLASSGRATLSAEVRDQLQSDPASWWVTDAGVRQFVMEVRDKVTALPLRPAYAPSCPRDIAADRFVLKRP